MSTTLKPVLGIVALIVVAVAIYYGVQWYGSSKTPVGSAVFTNEPAVLPSGASATDASLAKDTAELNAELKALDADSASVDASIEEAATVQ